MSSAEKVTSLATRPRAGTLVQDRITWTEDQIALIQRTVALGTSGDEFKLFLYQAARTGLDPLAKQIYAIKRWNAKEQREVMAIQTGIDGFRVVADRTRRYAGCDDTVFQGVVPTIGMNHATAEKLDMRATVTVYKIVQGVRCPFTATAYWTEYYPGEKQGSMWRNKPHVMLGKCAEALALRKAFPADLSGVYIHEEMEQAGEIVEAVVVTPSSPTAEPGPQPPATPPAAGKKRGRAKEAASPAATEPAPETPASPPASLTLAEVEKFARERFKDFDKKLSDGERAALFATAKQAGLKSSAELHPFTERLFGVSSVKLVPSSGLDALMRAILGEPEPTDEEPL